MSDDLVGLRRRPPSRHPIKLPTPPAEPAVVEFTPGPVVEVPTTTPAPQPPAAPPRTRRSQPRATHAAAGALPTPALEDSRTVVSSVRLRADQAEWLAEQVFLANRRLLDEAQAAGRHRLDYRPSDGDVLRHLIDLARSGAFGHQLLDGVIGEARRRRVGRPRKERS